MELTERIEALLLEKFSEPDFSDCFVVEIELKPRKRLEVFVDSDSAMDFAKCQRISRFLESHLDENGWLGEDYVLEISSPGIGRPLKFARQFVKNIGRELKIELANGATERGFLKSADESAIVLEQEKTIEIDGKKKKKQSVETTFKIEDVKKAIVQISF